MVMLAMIIITFLAYSSSIRAPFHFDDIGGIHENVTIRKLYPFGGPTGSFTPPPRTTVSGRPVINFSLALNYVFNEMLGIDQRGGPDPRDPSKELGPNKTISYHAANILLHFLCCVLILALIRRTLRHGWIGQKFAGVADLVAVTVTSIWLIHPIQSETLVYIIQRTELIVAACYLGTLYCSLRAWDAAYRETKVGWYIAAIFICLIGMGSKEVMITAPLTVMLYDRAFRTESWVEAIRKRWWFYLLLWLTTIWLLSMQIQFIGPGHPRYQPTMTFLQRFIYEGPRSNTVGFNLGITWFNYLYTQCWAILHYIQLFFWPDRLTLDYGPQMINDSRGVPGVMVLAFFMAVTIAAYIKPNKWVWWGAAAASLVGLIVLANKHVDINAFEITLNRFNIAFAAVLLVTTAGIATIQTLGLFIRLTRWVWLGGIAVTTLIVFLLPAMHAVPVAMGPMSMQLAPNVSMQMNETEWYTYCIMASAVLLGGFSIALLAPVLPTNRWGWLGFLGAWFFMILAPSSSIIPIATEMAAERRIYLSLVTVLVLLLLGVESLRQKWGSYPENKRLAWVLSICGGAFVFYFFDSDWLFRTVLSSRGDVEWLRALTPVLIYLFRLAVAVVATLVAFVVLRSENRPQRWKATWMAIGAAALVFLAFLLRDALIDYTVGVIFAYIVMIVAALASLLLLARSNERAVVLGLVIIGLAWTTYVRGKIYNDTEAIWRDVVLKSPENPRGFDNLGTTLAIANRIIEAEAWLKRSLNVDLNYLPGWHKLGVLAVNQGRLDEGRTYFMRAITLEPNYSPSLQKLGSLLCETGDPATGVQYLEKAAALEPTAENLLALGVGYVQAGRPQDGLRAFEASLQRDPYQVAARGNIGAVFVNNGQPDKAIPFLEQALKLDPNSPGSYLVRANLALAYGWLGKTNEAMEFAKQCLTAMPNEPRIHATIGQMYLRMNQPAEAVRELEIATKLNPRDVEALFNLGQSRRMLGNKVGALEAFQAASQLNPNYPPLRQAMEELAK
jgi:tetratricopeptide (TPR) repeat protein